MQVSGVEMPHLYNDTAMSGLPRPNWNKILSALASCIIGISKPRKLAVREAYLSPESLAKSLVHRSMTFAFPTPKVTLLIHGIMKAPLHRRL